MQKRPWLAGAHTSSLAPNACSVREALSRAARQLLLMLQGPLLQAALLMLFAELNITDAGMDAKVFHISISDVVQCGQQEAHLMLSPCNIS